MDRARHICPTKNSGFTLAELLVVVAIVGVLVAIAIPVFAASLASAKEAADLANCRSAQAAATTECIASYGGDFKKMTAEQCLATALASGIPKQGQVDPAATLNCTIAADNNSIKFFYGSAPAEGGGSGGSEGSGNGSNNGTFPGKDIPIVSADEAWPSQDLWNNGTLEHYQNATVKAGGVFQYSDGSYYVVTKDTQITQGQAASGPGGDLYSWFNTVKLTSKVITDWTTNTQKSDLQRGDLCYVNGSYYIYNDGGSWGSNPAFNSSQWYKLPA